MRTAMMTAMMIVVFLSVAACRSGGSQDEGSGEPEANARGGAEARGPVGVYEGTLSRTRPGGVTEQAPHEADIASHADGRLQVGVWEFCNVELTGEAPSYAVSDGARCLLDMGDGRREYLASGSASLEGEGLAFDLVFTGLDGDAAVGTWSFEGTWARAGTR